MKYTVHLPPRPILSPASPVIVAPFSGFMIFINDKPSFLLNPSGNNHWGRALIIIRIFSKILLGSPILSTKSCLREPQPTEEPGLNSHKQTE